MRAEILDVKETEVGRAAEATPNRTDAGEKAPWKNVPLDEIDRLAITIVAVIRDRNRLQQHHAVWLEQLGAFREIAR